MPSCCVSTCTNNIRQEGVRLFKLPRGVNNTNRREIWTAAIGKNDLHENSKICEAHFSADQFEKDRCDGRKLLKWNAVPDLLEIKFCECGTNVDAQLTTSTKINDTESQKTDVEDSNIDLFQQDMENLLSNSTTQQEQLINNLRKSLRKALHDRNVYKKKLEKKITNFDKIFEKDQLRFIEMGNAKGQKWSENTIDKSLKLYLACGAKGYKEIRRQNLPYPSIRTLQHRLQCLKFKPGENVYRK